MTMQRAQEWGPYHKGLEYDKQDQQGKAALNERNLVTLADQMSWYVFFL
jgi:hypothetical protein